MEPREMYADLYHRMKGPVLRHLLESEMGGRERRAVEVIARLPHPLEADAGRLRGLCRLLAQGDLEFLYPLENVGESARELLRVLEDWEEEPERPWPKSFPLPAGWSRPRGRRADQAYSLEDVGQLLAYNTDLVRSMHATVGLISSQTDIALKGRCTSCNGDLILREEYNNESGRDELHLRCRTHPNEDCLDWVVKP